MLYVVPPHFLACPRERSTPREDARVSHTQLVNVIEYRLCTTSSRRRNGLTAPPGDMLFPDGDKQRLPLLPLKNGQIRGAARESAVFKQHSLTLMNCARLLS